MRLQKGKRLEKKVSGSAKVKNKMGLHVRPATYIAKLLQTSQSKVTLTYKGESVNARSIMSIMILTAPKNAKIIIEAEGNDSEETLSKLLHAFETKFEEDI